MTRSENEARLVNLLPINDVYATVARLVAQRLYADASRTDWPEDQAWKGKAGSDPMRIIINDDPEQGPTIEMEEDGDDVFVIVSGVPIAKRSKTGTPRLAHGCRLSPAGPSRACSITTEPKSASLTTAGQSFTDLSVYSDVWINGRQRIRRSFRALKRIPNAYLRSAIPLRLRASLRPS